MGLYLQAELFLRNMSGFSLRERLDNRTCQLSSASASAFSPSPTDPSFASCLTWKHEDRSITCSPCLLPHPGAVIGDGQSAVASNIANTTYRLQWWDFTKFDLPEISNGKPK